MESTLQLWIDKRLPIRAQKRIAAAVLDFAQPDKPVTVIGFDINNPPPELAVFDGDVLVLPSLATLPEEWSQKLSQLTSIGSAEDCGRLFEESSVRQLLERMRKEGIEIGRDCEGVPPYVECIPGPLGPIICPPGDGVTTPVEGMS